MHQLSNIWAFFVVINQLISSMSTVLEMESGKNLLFTFIFDVNHLVSREIYTTGKNFILPPAVMALTNFTSGRKLNGRQDPRPFPWMAKVLYSALSYPFLNSMVGRELQFQVLLFHCFYQVYQYNITTEKWVEIGRMKTARHQHTTVEISTNHVCPIGKVKTRQVKTK